MKVLFLDVDGVLNGAYTRERNPAGTTGIDPRMALRLRRILETARPNVVISSTWRTSPRLVDHLWDRIGEDLKSLWIGNTPRHVPTGRERGHEIQAWLDASPDRVSRMVILDDDGDMVHLTHHLHQTDCFYGLTDADVDAVIARFQS